MSLFYEKAVKHLSFLAGSMLKGYMMKHGKRHFVLDENRRNTYNLFHPSSAAREASVLTTFDGERKQLLAVRII